tara:strand:- start:1444 stop:1779 length:336 start_codon:yes stop_codon:yes gene_type:complete
LVLIFIFTGELNVKANDILQKAKDAIDDRGPNYGHPREHFLRISKLWSTILGVDISVEEVGMMMMGVKMARIMENPKHLDNWIDIAGYAGVTGQAIIEDQIVPFQKDGMFS